MKWFSEIRQRTMDNGMSVFVVERPEQPAVEIQCHVRTGSIHEGEDLGCGLSHFLEHMLFQGCRDFPGTAAADRINALGGNANAYTGFDRTVYHCEVPAGDWAAGLEVLAKMVRYPEFPEARFPAERDVILRECELGRDNPDHRLTERLWNALYRVHPVRVPVIGYPDRIGEVTHGRMLAYYRRRYAPGRMFWVVVGAVDAGRVFAEVEKFHGDWPRGVLAEPVLPAEPPSIAARTLETEFADPLARIATAVRIPGAGDPDLPALDLLSGILGMSDASRLVRTLRQERNLAVEIESFCYAASFGGTFGVLASAAPGKFDALRRALDRAWAELRRDGVTPGELAREKAQQLAEQLRQLRGNAGIAATVGGGIHAAGTPLAAVSYLKRLEAVTGDEMRQAVGRYLAEAEFTTVWQRPPAVSRPVDRPPAKRSPAAAREGRLASGLRWVAIPERSLPLAEVSLVVPAGVIFEPAGQGGAARLAANLLTAGCGRHSEAAVAERLERLGVSLQTAAGMNSFCINANVPRRNFGKLMALFGEMAGRPAMSDAAFVRERANQREEWNSRRQQPRFAADTLAAEMLFGKHPYGRSPFGTGESLAALEPETVRAYWRDALCADQCVIGFGGDLDEEEAERAAGEFAAAVTWRDGRRELPPPPVFPERPAERRVALAREQTVIDCVLAGDDCRSATTPVFQVLASAMNGLSSPLFKAVREEHALAYTTGMRMAGGWHRGMLNFFAVTAAESVGRARTLLLDEIARLGQTGLTGKEFADAQTGAIFVLERQFSEIGSRLAAATLDVFYGDPADRTRDEIAALRKLTPEEANAVLRRYCGGAAVQVAIAGRLE